MRLSTGMVPFGGSRGHLSPVPPNPWHMAALLQFSFHLTQPSAPSLTFLASSYNDPCDYNGPTWTIQANLFISRSLISGKSLLSYKHSQIPGIGTSLGGHYATHHLFLFLVSSEYLLICVDMS